MDLGDGSPGPLSCFWGQARCITSCLKYALQCLSIHCQLVGGGGRLSSQVWAWFGYFAEIASLYSVCCNNYEIL